MDVLFAPTLFLRRVKSQQIVPPKKCSMLVLGLAILCDMCIHFFAQKILSEPFIFYIYIYRQKLLDHFTLHLVSLSSLRVLSNFLFLKSLSVYSQVLPEFSTSFFSLFKSAPLHQFSLEKPKAASCCQHHIAAVWRTCQTPWQSTWRPRCIDLLLGVERTFESDTFEHVEDKVAEQRMC